MIDPALELMREILAAASNEPYIDISVTQRDRAREGQVSFPTLCQRVALERQDFE
jgi:hypothetical protein